MFPNESGSPDLAMQILCAAGAPMFLLSKEGFIAGWNRAIVTLTGIPAEDAVGRFFPETFSAPEDTGQWRQALSRMTLESPEISLSNRWQLDRQATVLTCKCVLLAADPQIVVCTILNSSALPASREPSDLAALARAVLAERSAELGEIGRFIHDTVAQDLVRLSFTVYKSNAIEGSSPAESWHDQTRDLVELCCSRIRVLTSMLTPPQAKPFQLWLEDYVEFLREEAGLLIHLSVDPIPVVSPDGANLLLGVAVQTWIAKAIRLSQSRDVVIRFRRDAEALVLELGASHPHPERFTTGWSAILALVEAMGGSLELHVEAQDARATVHLRGSS
jgi:signal transduction histidine kinase